MKVFLIIVAVIVVIIAAICSLSATVTLVYDKGWSTKVKVLFIEKDIVLSEILSFMLFPERKAQEVAEKSEENKQTKTETKPETKTAQTELKPTREEKREDAEIEAQLKAIAEKEQSAQQPEEKAEAAPAPKPNPIQKLWNEEGIVGILELVSNLVETANSAILTLFRGLHIYSLYVMIIVGGGDADLIARAYGTLCKYYYPVKGIILNGMKVDNYDDYIQPDFIADRSEFEFQLIASINVGLLLRMVFKAGAVFLKNLIKAKKG